MEGLVGEIVRRLDPAGFEPHVMALQYLGRFARGLDRHAQLHLVDGLPPWSMLWPKVLASRIRRIEPDVVHTHSGVWYKGSRAARMAGVPRLVHTEHGRTRPDPWSSRLLDHLASRRTDVTVAVSARLVADLREAVRVDDSGIELVRNGVDTRRFHPRSKREAVRVRRALGLPPDGPVLGCVGRLEEVKGHRTMLRAFHALVRDLAGRGSPPELVLIGDGALRPELEDMAADGAAAGNVHFLGWRNDVAALHPALDVYTLSSRTEGTSVSLLEAMASGLCPVVTDVGGNGDVLGPELRHRLVRPGDPEALAGAWRAALDDRAARRRDARAARARVVDAFSVESMVRKYQRIYRGGAAGRDERVSAA